MNKVEIAFVLDRSGSMSSVKKDAIGGFNSFLAEQKAQPGEAVFTLALFDDQYDVIHNGIDLQRVPELNERTFVPRGWTALYDAIGRTVNAIAARTDEGDKVIIAILTDGAENKSREYTRDQIHRLLEEKQAKGWTVIYLGANQDAFAVGSSLGVLRGSTYQFDATSKGMATAYADMTISVSAARVGPI